MNESIIIAVFFIVLIALQIKEQRNIVIKARKSRMKLLLSILLSCLLLVIFWPSQLENRIDLVTFTVAILFNGLFREGLSDDHLVKLGNINTDYKNYEKIELEYMENGNVFINFYKRKNNSVSLIFDQDILEIKNFFISLKLGEKLILKASR